MKTYHIRQRSTQFLHVQVEASDRETALQLGRELLDRAPNYADQDEFIYEETEIIAEYDEDTNQESN